MLKVLGGPRRCCDGVTRRESLKVGALSALGGFGLPHWLEAKEAGLVGLGKAKSVILLYLLGGAATQDMFDLKPEAPDDVRSEFKPITTSAAGVQICEHLPKVARVMDRATVVRSMNHPYPLHCLAYATSGNPSYDVSLETNIRDPRHWPVRADAWRNLAG